MRALIPSIISLVKSAGGLLRSKSGIHITDGEMHKGLKIQPRREGRPSQALRFAFTRRRTDGAGGFFGIAWMSKRTTLAGVTGKVVVMATVISAWPAPVARGHDWHRSRTPPPARSIGPRSTRMPQRFPGKASGRPFLEGARPSWRPGECPVAPLAASRAVPLWREPANRYPRRYPARPRRSAVSAKYLKSLAGGLGFEPRLTESESVRPLR